MKQYFLSILVCLLITQQLLSSTSYLKKNEYQDWVVFKKYTNNATSLLVAKQFRYNDDPIIFGYSFKKNQFLDAQRAEKLWDKFDIEYEEFLKSQNPEQNS